MACLPPTGEGDCNPDKRLPAASLSSRCARLSWILVGTSGVMLHSQSASTVLAVYVSKPGLLEYAPLWRRRDDFRHIEVIHAPRIEGSTQSWALLALLTCHARRGDEDEEVQTSPPQSFPFGLSRAMSTRRSLGE